MVTAKEQEIVDSIIRHQTYIDRFGAGLANRVLDLIDNDELFALVMSKRKLTKKIKALLEREKKTTRKLIYAELGQVARIELQFARQLTADFRDLKYSRKEMDTLIQIALEKPLVVTNSTPQDLYDSAWRRKEEISTSLNSMGELGLKESVLIDAELMTMFAQFARSMEVANKTFSFAVSNEMREKAYKDSRVVKFVVMSAVLDGRTTPYCMNIDGEKFPNGKGPRPPFHPRCRTIGVPIIEGQTDEDIEDLLSYRSQVGPGEYYEKGDSTTLRAHKRQIERGKVKVIPAGKSKESSSNYANFLASQMKTKKGIQFIEDRIGIKKGRRFIKLIENGMDPKKALNEILFETEAKDLDIKGLEKRLSQ